MKLKINDRVYSCAHGEYSIETVKSVTPTTATLENGRKYRNEPTDYGYYVSIGRLYYAGVYLLTPEKEIEIEGVWAKEAAKKELYDWHNNTRFSINDLMIMREALEKAKKEI